MEGITMKVAVFGAAGGTGRHVVKEAVAAGHDVTVRDPAKLSPTGAQVRVEVGDARDPRVVGSRIARADVARWLVEQLDQATYSQRAVSLW